MPKPITPTEPRQVARLLCERGVTNSSGYASELARSVKLPSYELAMKIEDVTGIPVSHWAAVRRAVAAQAA